MSRDVGNREGEQQRVVVGDGGPTLLDRIFRSLAHPRRRCVLYYMREEQQADLDGVAAVVAAWEEDVETDDVSAETREQIRLELCHVHLPKLKDYGLVEYDHRSETVRYNCPPDALDEVVDIAATIEEPP